VGSDFLGPIAFFGFLATVIVMPLYFRHQRNLKTIELVALALEKNSDPETVLRSLPPQREGGDINGNWKAGQILIWVGLVFGLVMLTVIGAQDDLRQNAGLAPLIPACISITLGIVLLAIHRRIVGVVRTVAAAQPLPHGEAGGTAEGR
jgi:hypothetical protein